MMFALVDCNNFYVSCERVFNPKLQNRPVIVLSNNDGCAVSRSEEAKALGIAMATPAFMVQDLIRANNVVLFSSNYTLYGDMSDRVMNILASFVPALELYSIDEAFLDLTQLKYTDLTELGARIRETVLQQTGIPVTVGIAANKTLSKMANRYAKKKLKIGVFAADTPDKVKQMLQDTAVMDVWGIGRQHGARLEKIGMKTAFDLLQLTDDWMRKNMSVVGQRLLNELKGISCIPLELVPPAKKNICTSRSFGKLTKEKTVVEQAVANFASRCASKLRREKSCAGLVHVFVHTDINRKQDEQYFKSISIQLKVATNNTTEIVQTALAGLDRIFKHGINYQKAGVMVVDIVPADEVQQSLYDKRDRSRDKKITDAMDNINKSFGTEIVKLAVQMGTGWHKREAYLSPCYTTRLDHILTVKC